MAARHSLTATRLRELLHYDPLTGVFTWRIGGGGGGRWGHIPAGTVAGSKSHNYWEVSVDGVRVLAHIAAWLYMTGEWPRDQIDHKDRNGSNNRFDNLRESDQGQNLCNTSLRSNSASGFRGVKLHRASGLWQARVQFRGQEISAGYHPTAEQAAKARDTLAIKLHGVFVVLNFPTPLEAPELLSRL